MTLARWNPWQEMNALQRQFDRLFDDVLVPSSLLDKEFAKVPAVELHESEDAIHLKVELPGMEAKDLDVQVTENTVSISGERRSETRVEEKGMTRSEFHYGKIQRVIPLPSRIQNNNVTAEYKDGILNLTMPKTEQDKNKVVKVNLN
jgi:HSP20 family protein